MANAKRDAAVGRADNPSCAQKPRARARRWRPKSTRLLRAGFMAGAGLLALAPALATETITYAYDELGRLHQVAHSGSVNGGVSATYNLDLADNRTSVAVSVPVALPTLSIGNANATEGSAITFTVTRSSGTGSSSVIYGTSDGTARAGTDYTTASGTLNFVAGDTFKTFTVPTIDNALVDGNRNFTVNLSSASGATIATGQATGTVNDNDSPSLSISGGNTIEGGQITFTVTRSSGSGTSSVSYATSDGTAHAGADYTGTSNSLSFAAGDTAKTFTVSTNNDTIVNQPQSRNFTVNLSNASGATIGTGQATGTINDNDSPPSFSISPSTVSATEGQPLGFTVTRSGATTGTYTVTYATANGTAIAGNDYNANSATLTFAAAGSQPVTVTTIDDSLSEPNENFSVNLTGASGGATITPGQGTATGTIIDNEPSSLVLTVPSGGPVNLRSLATGYSNQSSVTFNLLSGSTVTGGAGGGAAIDTGSWPAGVTLALNVSGTVRGGGGNGGNGGSGTSFLPTAGGAGGDAIRCNANFAITVTGTVQSGGGGGGGAGGAVAPGVVIGGGGGGGGAPNGLGGVGGNGGGGGPTGGAGSPGTTSGGGAGGAGSAPPGGAGGTYATNGTGGGNNGAPPGFAGYAVRKNGTTCTLNGSVTGTVG